MEKQVLIFIPVFLVVGPALLALFQQILNHLHKPYLEDGYKNSDTVKVYIYQRGRAAGSYTCFCFKKVGDQWHYVFDRLYIGSWVLTYIITAVCFAAVFYKLEILSVMSVIIGILGISVLFVLLIVFDIFLSYLTMKKLMKE